MPQNNEWDDAVGQVLHQQAQDTATQVRNNVQFAVDANPDKEAGYKHLAQFVGVPVDTVRAQPDAIKQQAAMQQMDAGKLAQDFPHTAGFLTDLNNTRMIHDDVPGTAAVEQQVKALPKPPLSAQAPQIEPQDKSVWQSIKDAPFAGLQGLGGSFSKAAGSLNVVLGAIPTYYDKAASLITGQQNTSASDWWFRNMVDPRVNQAPAYEPEKNAGFAEKAFHTTGSLLGTLSQIVLSGTGGEAPAAATSVKELVANAVEHGTKSMAFPALSDAVDTGRKVYAQTGDAGTAARAAQMQYVTSTMAGVVPLNAPGNLAIRLATGFGSGIATSESSRQLMNMVMPDSMQQPLSAEDMIMSGLAGSIMGGVMGPRAEPNYHAQIRQTYIEAAQADAAQKSGEMIQALGQVSAASKLRERDPQAFRDFVQQVTDDGHLQDVYIDAKELTNALNQSGVSNVDLAARMPEVAEQLHEAAQTNGDVRIPVADYATHIAGGPIDQAILPHLKAEPDGMTYKEGQEYYQNQAETMKAQAEKIMAAKQADDVHTAEAQAVHDHFLNQLNAADRFPEHVNKAYAALMRDFYSVNAERMGITPAEMLERYPLKVQAEKLAGAALDQGAADKRAAFDPETNTIALLKKADLSSFLHESGHFFLETMHDMAGHPEAPAGIKSDFDMLLKSFGEKGETPEQRLEDWSGKTLDEKRDAHEQFARGFEAYLMEGKAPSIELAGLFSRFRSWLLNIYKSLSNLNVDLTAEVRGVMDRLLASDEAIRQAQQVRGYDPLFKTAEAAGMTPEEYAQYQTLGVAATEDAVAEMDRKSLKDMQWLSNAKSKAMKALQKEAAGKRKGVQDEVTKVVMSEPVNRARQLLTKAKFLDEHGNELPDTRSLGAPEYKLNRADLDQLYPEGALGNPDLAKLRGMTSKEGMHPDIIAEMFGISDGHELIRQLTEGESVKDKIARLTDEVMLQRHGELVDPASIERAAEAAIHNEARARFVATELKALSKAMGPAKMLAEAAKQAAESAIATKRVRDIRPAQYTAAEARAAKNAEKALGKDDIQAAAVEKRAQLLNNRLAKVAADAIEEVRKGVDYLKKFDKTSVRDKIDLEYRDQIDALLDRYDLRKSTTGTALDKKEALAAFVERMAAQGYEPQIPEKLLNELERTHYKDMTVEDFRGLVDAVKSIEHLGRLKTKLLDLKEARELADLANEAKETAAKLPQREKESNRGLTAIEQKWLSVKASGRSMQASLLKMEQMFDWLDNRNPNGVFNRVVFRRIADAGVKEYELQSKVKAEIDKLLHTNLADVTRDKNTIYIADGLIDGLTREAQKFTKKEMLALAGNVGNESNMAKLVKGEGWSEQAVWNFLHKNMSKADWDFVAGLGRTLESLWPEKLAMSRRLGNTNPEKIAPRAFDTPHGRYDGWYWPMVYDPARSHDVAMQGAKNADAMFENTYARANTDTGRTITRNENYARPLLLSLDVIPRVIKDEIHDIAYREAIIDADKFLSDKTVREAIQSALSPEHYDQLRPWLQSIANDRKVDMQALKWFDRMAHGARTRSTIVGLGYRVSTMLVHGTSAAAESIAELGPVWMAKGLADFARPDQWAANRDFIFERSGEMRNRMNEVDRDVREHIREIDLRLMDTTTGAIARGADVMKAHAYEGIAMLDMASALPTWMGAYHKAMASAADGGLGMSETDAVYFADKTVRNAHGGTGVKDLAAVQRGPEFFKLFTMFYTFWNHNVNRLMDTARMAKSLPDTFKNGEEGKFKGDLGMVIMRTLIYTLGVQAVHSMLHPSKDDQGDKNWLAWAGKEFTAAAFSGVPVLRDLAAHYLTGKDYSVTPAAGMVQAIGASGMDAMNAAVGNEPHEKWLKHTVTTAGYVFGLPLGQPSSAIQFLWDVASDKANPQNIADWWRGVIHGDMKPH